MENRVSALFGPGGNGDWFKREGNKSTLQAPDWVRAVGLDAYEFEAGQGLRTPPETLQAIGDKAREAGIHMSFHTPYFISLSGVEEQTRLKSIDYLSQSVQAAKLLGAGTIVIHTGSAAKISREEAMALCLDTLEKAMEQIPFDGVLWGLETMGKVNQLGTVDEVISLCKRDARLVPVVDFGHVNARERGGQFETAEDYRRVFDRIGTALGDETARNMHCHFSKIEWTAAGEKRHLTFADEVYGPAFEPLAEAMVREKLTPVIICESAGTQAEDALFMKTQYQSLYKKG